jgi:hypothetical protein
MERPTPMKMEQAWNGLYLVPVVVIVVGGGFGFCCCLKFLEVGFVLSQKENCLKVHLL